MTADGEVGSIILFPDETAPEVYQTLFTAVLQPKSLIVGNDALSGSALIGAHKAQHFYLGLQNGKARLQTCALARGFQHIARNVNKVIYIDI